MKLTIPEPRILKRRIIIFSIPVLLAAVVFAGVKLASFYPFIVEEYYSKGIYPAISGIFSFISNAVPFSLWDFTWITLLFLIICGFLMVLFRRMKLRYYLFGLALTAFSFYSLFYISWGLNYFRPDIESRLSWKKVPPDEKAFRLVLDQLIINANRTHSEITFSDYAGIDSLLEVSYNKCSNQLGVIYPNGYRRPKSIILSSYFAKSGISGYFGPFFNEVHVNSYELPVDYPFVLAHEKAHQFGFANEAEANLAAFAVCSGSTDNRLQYSGYLHILLYFLADARQFEDYGDLVGKIDKPVLKDIMFRQKYYNELRNEKLEKMQTAANDVYLKSQNIENGVMNYNQVVGLIISWYNNAGQADILRSSAPVNAPGT